MMDFYMRQEWTRLRDKDGREMGKFRGEIGLLLVSIIWGSGFIASAIGLGYMSPNETLSGRFLVAAVLLVALNLKNLRALKRETIRKGGILGIFLYIAFVLQTVGLKYTTPSKNAFLTAVNVAVVPFIGYLFYRKNLNKKDILRALIAMVGVGAISLQWSGAINFGDFLSFLCALAFAFHIYFTGEFMEEEKPLELTMVQMVTAFLIAMAVMALKGESLLGHDSRGYLAVVYLGIFSTTIAFLVQTISQKYMKSSRAAVIMSTESLFAMVFSIVILKEQVAPRMILGALIIFAAIILPQGKEESALEEAEELLMPCIVENMEEEDLA